MLRIPQELAYPVPVRTTTLDTSLQISLNGILTRGDGSAASAVPVPPTPPTYFFLWQ